MPWPCGQQVAETVSAGAELCTPTRHTYAHTTTQALVSVVTDADQWGGTSSIGFWQSDDGVAMFTNRQLWLQNDMLWNQPPGFLVSEMPYDPSKHWDQSACSVAEKWVFVKDIISRHRPPNEVPEAEMPVALALDMFFREDRMGLVMGIIETQTQCP